MIENAGKETTKTALQASRSSHPERLTHEQSQIQRPAVDQQAFEDVVVPTQMSPSHAAGPIQMREWPLHSFTPDALQTLAPVSADSSSVRVDLATGCEIASPLASSTIRLGDVRAYPFRLDVIEHRSRVIALVRDQFLQAA